MNTVQHSNALIVALLWSVLLLVITCKTSLAQESAGGLQHASTTNGREFFFGFMRNFGGTGFTTLQLRIGTTFAQAEYVVESQTGIIQQGTVLRGSPVTLEIPHNLQISSSDYDDREKGLHVFTTNDTTIFMIAENFVSPFNYGVFVPYPCFTSETDIGYEYYVISTEVADNSKSQVLLVGCENDTEISIIPSQSISLPQDLQVSNVSLFSQEIGSKSNRTLHQMQTLLLSSQHDLTGTIILSNKPLTVIAGHECASIPSHLTGCEPLAVQVPPSLTWGNTFLLSTFSGRETDSIIKFVAAKETSVLVVCGLESADSIGFSNVTSQQVSLSVGRSCFVASTNPILLVQFATSGFGDGRGDPAVTLISPIDQYVSNISFLAPPINDFTEVYLGVTVSAEHFNRSSILLNQEIVDCDWNEIYNTSSANSSIVGYGCNSNITNKLDSMVSQYSMSHSDPEGVFSVIVYGFGTSGLGFAYLAGQEITAGFIGNIRVPINPDQSNAIPFYDITGFPGVSELDRVEDGFSEPIIIPNGLLFGEDLVTTAFVNENGVISFEDPWEFSYPDRFPTPYYWTRLGKAIAPFWSDNDIRKEGNVRYTTYCNILNQNQCEFNADGQAILDEVNQFIQDSQANNNLEPFTGNWMLIAQWDHVHPSPHGADDTGGIPPEELSMTNTYQAIVISNIFRTIMIFTYICGDVQWSAVGASSDIAVVGYNAAGNRFFNHRLSGYSSVGDSLSCAVRLGKRRKRQSDMNGMVSMEVQNSLGMCLNMLGIDEGKFDENEISSYMNMVEPCPPTRTQAVEDTARFKRQNEQCFVSMKPIIVRDSNPLSSQTVSVVSQCCYDTGGSQALITTPSLAAGSLLLQHPLREPQRYNRNMGADFGDKIFKDICCNRNLADINMGSGQDYCAMYFQRRPISSSTGYNPPVLGIGSGDPHYTTFDGVYYDFQGTGDFTLFETSPPSVKIQARLERIIFDRVATWHVLLAFGDSVAAFEVGKQPNLRVFRTKPDDEQSEISSYLPLNQVWVDDDDLRQVELTRILNNHNLYSLLANFFISGISIKVNINIFNERHYLNFEVRVPRSLSPTLGLLGNLDDDPSVEFFRRGENTHISYPPGTRPDQLVFDPLMTWETHSEESLFVPSRKKRQAPDPSPTPIFYDELNFTDDQRLFCENNPQCLYDLVVSDNTDVAQETLNSEKEANATIETINNFPPNISADTTLRMMLGQESVLFLSVSDSNNNFTLRIEGDPPENSLLEETSEGSYVFRWTLNEVTNKTLVFVANDSRGASSLFTPTVEICACVNGGTCTLDGLITSNTTIVMNCLCTDAFDGRFCEEDRNGCSEIQCFEGVECMDIPAPGVGAVCGLCPPGYTGNLRKCYDINECLLNGSLCEQVCVNTEGGYFCSCQDGFNLIEGTNQCKDIDECKGVNDCQQVCQNTIGSYSCNCTNGFTLAQDGASCFAIVPCDGVCSFGCAVIGDEEQCFCPIGFELDTSNETQCIDQNECTAGNPCEQVCVNNEGSFICSCEMGYVLSSDERGCIDTDECFEAALELTNLCASDPNSQCFNNDGSFECVCVPGYSRDVNGSCQRVASKPPPIMVVLLPLSANNSVKFVSPTLLISTFTSNLQQKFREVTARAVNNYCMVVSCTLMLPSGEIEMIVGTFTIGSENVAIPLSLVTENERHELTIAVYIQIGSDFLLKEHLELAIMQAEDLFREAGFLSFDKPTLPTEPMTDVDITLIGIIVGSTSFAALVLCILVLISIIVRCKKYNNHVSKKKKFQVTTEDEIFTNKEVIELQ